ncbi:hypothetical protein FA95DRAFT_1462509, partial [Auriscalpium vulgare]
TGYERLLQEALKEAEARDVARKKSMVAMQAGVVLQDMYVKRSQRQLQRQEEKQANKGKKRVLGDGFAHLLTRDAFYTAVENFEQAQEKEKLDKQARQDRRGEYREAVDLWRVQETARKARIKKKRAEYHTAVEAWQ